MRFRDDKGNSWKHTNGIGLILIPLIVFLLIVDSCVGQDVTKTIISHRPSQEVVYFDDNNSNRTINAISPTTISAGSNNVLTITGEGFGERNQVFFANANYGGAGYTAIFDSQILLWTDTEIQVEVPTFAGSGDVRVVTLDDEVLIFDGLVVPYAILNSNHNSPDGYVAGRFSHVGEYLFSINLPSPARELMIDAIDDVRCKTAMNWDFGNNTTLSDISADGINLIAFSSDLPNNVLAATYNRYAGCINNGEVDWYLQEIDIAINVNFSWNYDDTIDSTQHDFLTVMIHELLHAAGLGHIIEPDAIMHFSVASGVIKRDMVINEYDGRADQQNWSTTNEVCGEILFIDGECETLGIPEYTLRKDIQNVEVWDIQGRKIQDYPSIKNIPNGMWIVKINYNNGKYINKKLIIK